MNPLSILAWGAPGIIVLLFGLLCLPRRWRGRLAESKSLVEVQPGCRSLLRRLGLTTPDHFLSLPSLTISGHPDRNVSRLTLGQGAEAISAFLKREHRVPWLV